MGVKVTGNFEPAGNFKIVDGKDVGGALTGSAISSSTHISASAIHIGGGTFTSESLANSVSSYTELTDIPSNIISSSNQIGTEITGAFHQASASFSTRVTVNDAKVGYTDALVKAKLNTDNIVSGSALNVRTFINVEDGAEVNQTDVEIKTAYESNDDTNAFTDIEKLQLGNIEAGADITDAGNVHPILDAKQVVSGSTDRTFTITANGFSAYIFGGDGFTPGGESAPNENPTIYLTRGETYRFVNALNAHPLRIQETPNGTNGSQYNEGITGNDVSNGTLVFQVQMNAPRKLYYQCTAHPAMGGTIHILDHASGNITGSNISGSGTGSFEHGYIAKDLIVDGIVVASEIHTTFISSSVTYATSSNQFGDSADDKHMFTGSIEILGHIKSNGIGLISSSAQLTPNIISGSGQITELGFISQSNNIVNLPNTKIQYANVYSNLGDLPNAGDYHGMFAHVHGTGKAYYAHAGEWIQLANISVTGSIDTNTTAISTLNSSGIISSSNQIKTEITGAFHQASASFSTRVTVNDAKVGYADTLVKQKLNSENVISSSAQLPAGTISSSNQIKTEITGAFYEASHSLQGRVKTLEDATVTLPDNLISSSIQIGTEISGAIDAATGSLLNSYAFISSSDQIGTEITGAFYQASHSLQTRVTANETQLATLQAGGSDNLGNHTASMDLDMGGNPQVAADTGPWSIKNVLNISASGTISSSGHIIAKTLTGSLLGNVTGTATTASYIETAQTASYVTASSIDNFTSDVSKSAAASGFGAGGGGGGGVSSYNALSNIPVGIVSASNGHITASGNISASGDITARSASFDFIELQDISFTDDTTFQSGITVEGNTTVKGTLNVASMGAVAGEKRLTRIGPLPEPGVFATHSIEFKKPQGVLDIQKFQINDGINTGSSQYEIRVLQVTKEHDIRFTETREIEFKQDFSTDNKVYSSSIVPKFAADSLGRPYTNASFASNITVQNGPRLILPHIHGRLHGYPVQFTCIMITSSNISYASPFDPNGLNGGGIIAEPNTGEDRILISTTAAGELQDARVRYMHFDVSSKNQEQICKGLRDLINDDSFLSSQCSASATQIDFGFSDSNYSGQQWSLTVKQNFIGIPSTRFSNLAGSISQSLDDGTIPSPSFSTRAGYSIYPFFRLFTSIANPFGVLQEDHLDNFIVAGIYTGSLSQTDINYATDPGSFIQPYTGHSFFAHNRDISQQINSAIVRFEGNKQLYLDFGSYTKYASRGGISSMANHIGYTGSVIAGTNTNDLNGYLAVITGSTGTKITKHNIAEGVRNFINTNQDLKAIASASVSTNGSGNAVLSIYSNIASSFSNDTGIEIGSVWTNEGTDNPVFPLGYDLDDLAKQPPLVSTVGSADATRANYANLSVYTSDSDERFIKIFSAAGLPNGYIYFASESLHDRRPFINDGTDTQPSLDVVYIRIATGSSLPTTGIVDTLRDTINASQLSSSISASSANSQLIISSSILGPLENNPAASTALQNNISAASVIFRNAGDPNIVSLGSSQKSLTINSVNNEGNLVYVYSSSLASFDSSLTFDHKIDLGNETLPEKIVSASVAKINTLSSAGTVTYSASIDATDATIFYVTQSHPNDISLSTFTDSDITITNSQTGLHNYVAKTSNLDDNGIRIRSLRNNGNNGTTANEQIYNFTDNNNQGTYGTSLGFTAGTLVHGVQINSNPFEIKTAGHIAGLFTASLKTNSDIQPDSVRGPGASVSMSFNIIEASSDDNVFTHNNFRTSVSASIVTQGNNVYTNTLGAPARFIKTRRLLGNGSAVRIQTFNNVNSNAESILAAQINDVNINVSAISSSGEMAKLFFSTLVDSPDFGDLAASDSQILSSNVVNIGDAAFGIPVDNVIVPGLGADGGSVTFNDSSTQFNGSSIYNLTNLQVGAEGGSLRFNEDINSGNIAIGKSESSFPLHIGERSSDGMSLVLDGEVSSSSTASFAHIIMNYDKLPTSDPLVRGQIYRDGSNNIKISSGS